MAYLIGNAPTDPTATLAVGIDAAAVQITLTGAYAEIPDANGSGDVAPLMLYDEATGLYEWVHVTNRTAAVCDILRGQEGTTAIPHAANVKVAHGPPPGCFDVQVAGFPSIRKLGTGATDAAAGDHNHSGVYDPAGSASAAQAASQPVDAQLTELAGLDPANDDFIQEKSGVLTNRTPAQVKADLPFPIGVTVRVATAANVPNSPTYAAGTLDATTNGALVLDGVTMAVDNVFLHKNGPVSANRGIYKVTNAGSAGTKWQAIRDPRFNASAKIEPGLSVAVRQGTNGDTLWLLTTDGPITMDTTALTFTQIAGTKNAYTNAVNTFTPRQILMGGFAIDKELILGAAPGDTALATTGKSLVQIDHSAMAGQRVILPPLDGGLVTFRVITNSSDFPQEVIPDQTEGTSFSVSGYGIPGQLDATKGVWIPAYSSATFWPIYYETDLGGGANHWWQCNPHYPTQQATVNTAFTSGAGTISLPLGKFQEITLVGNMTVDSTIGQGCADGEKLKIRFRQNAVGGYTVGWGVEFRFPGGTPPIIAAGANAISIVEFMYDRTADKWDCINYRIGLA